MGVAGTVVRALAYAETRRLTQEILYSTFTTTTTTWFLLVDRDNPLLLFFPIF